MDPCAVCAAPSPEEAERSGRWPHLHFRFVPRYPGTLADYRGLEVRDGPGVPRCNWDEIAAELRRVAR